MAKKSTKKATKKAAKKMTKKVAKKATKKAAKKATKKATKKVATKKVAPKKTATKKAATKKTATKKAPAKKGMAKKAVAPKVSAPKAAPAKAASPKAVKSPALPIPAVGAMAPTFTLRDQNGQMVSLENFRGSSVLVYFYPRAMTPGCTVQACGLRDSQPDLAQDGIIVLGISPDEPAALKKFAEKDQLNFALLSDPDNSVAKAYGAYGPKSFMGKNFDGILRQSYLVGKDGQILHVISKVDTATHANDVLELFKKHA